MMQPPVIVIPGITATTLEDFYPLEPQTIWSAVFHKEYARIALHPDDVRYEAIEPARVVPRNPYTIAYGDLVEALRHDLTKKADRPTPVFGFGYDWRQDCTQTANRLDSFIDEVLARTSLLPHYHREPPTEVDLVGHSMGGLIIARYLRSKEVALATSSKAGAKVRRVATIATPFRGSVDAILKLTIGMGSLGGPDPRDRERESARTVPALYQLLPTFAGAVEALSPNAPTDIFQVSAWQPSVLATLREFIRLNKARIDAPTLLQNMLDGARTFIREVNALDPVRVLSEGTRAWLPIVGLGEKTQVSAGIRLVRQQPWFEFADAKDEMDEDGRRSENTGDGTVPFLGAHADFLERRQLVGVTMDDLSFWEIRDRVLAEAAGLHGFLPKVNLVQKLVIRFLRDDFDGHFKAHRPPGVTGPLSWPSWIEEHT